MSAAIDHGERRGLHSTISEDLTRGLERPRDDDLSCRDHVFDALLRASNQWEHFGRYIVLGTLGRGGMGTVFKAFDRTLDRRVAIKVLHREIQQRHEARLLREAQALAKLSHPNVVQVYELDELDGQTFVVMELVQGRTLVEWMKAGHDWRTSIEVFLQVGAGLAAAHARGLVHRDFKPSNAIIDETGRVRVLDFGLARLAGRLGFEDRTTEVVGARADPGLELSLTRTGAVLGTPAYMSPEQMRGGDSDGRSDQFSFCATLFEALYGQRPFEAGSLAAMLVSMRKGQIRSSRMDSRVPSRVRRVLMRGLAPDPEDRWPSMDALLAELRALLTPRRQWWMTATLVTAGIAMGAGLLIG